MRPLCLILASAITGCGAVSSVPQPAATPSAGGSQSTLPAPTGDVYFGEALLDPYRWLESPSDPRARAWIAKETVDGQRTLDSIPGMSELRGRLQALTEGSESIDDVKLAGGRLFYLRRRKGETASRLFVLSPGRPERVLWSPPSGGDTSAAIAHVSPSSDGRFVGYGVATGGSEDETFFVVDVETGRNLPDRLEHLTQVSLSWVNGQEAFYYTRFPHFRDGDAGAIYTAPQAMLHRLGTPVSEDTVAISAQTDASILTDPKDIPIIVSRAGSLYLLALVYRGTSSDTAIFARPIDGKGPWAKLVGFENAVSDWALSGSSLYVIMRQNSPLGQVARLDLSHPSTPTVVLEATGRALANVVSTKDAVYVVDGDFQGSTIRRLGARGGSVSAIDIPPNCSVTDLTSDVNGHVAAFQVEGWLQPARWLAATDGRSAMNAAFPEQSSVLLSDVSVEHMEATSRDGTRIPLTVISGKNARRDGTAPVILLGYGAYEVSILPRYNAQRIAWLERGGILAFAHVRGGGELGREWHVAAMREKKQTSIDDFTACAEHLIRVGVASPRRLAADGASAGGLLVGVAVDQRPDLFRAAYVGSGMVNLLRQLRVGAGPSNEEEFGSPVTPSAFRSLLKMDAYQQVQRGVSYPAILVTTGLNDARVPYWQSAKYVAKLREATTSGNPVVLWIEPDSGHGAESVQQSADEMAYEYGFFLWQFGLMPGSPPQ